MRKVISEQSYLGSTNIGATELDTKSRDDIPALLIGLQAIYLDEGTRTELFRLTEEHVLPGRRRNTGRPGMDLWRILVMGILKQGSPVRLRPSPGDREPSRRRPSVSGPRRLVRPCRYELQTIRNNMALLTPGLLSKAGDLVTASGMRFWEKAWRAAGRTRSAPI